MDTLENIKRSILDGDESATREAVLKALDEKIEISKILNDGLIDTMTLVGELWKKDEIFMPEVLISASAMKMGMKTLQPALEAQGVLPIGKVVIGTVKSDIHDIGKNIVGMMLLGAGFEVVDLGTDVPEEKFIEAVIELKPDILAISALLTTTISELGVVIEAFEKAGIRDDVKIMVGGAPVTAEHAKKIGADGYAPDAASAAQQALLIHQ